MEGSTLGLAESLAAAEIKKKPSLYDTILAALSKEDQAVFLEALADPTVSAPKLAKALRLEGFTVSDTIIRNWRRDAQ